MRAEATGGPAVGWMFPQLGFRPGVAKSPGALAGARARAQAAIDDLAPSARTFILTALLLAVVIAVATGASSYWSYLGFEACDTILLVLAAGLVFSHAGMLSLCPLSFAAVGAWMAGYFAIYDPRLPFPFVLAAAMAVAVPIGAVIGLLAMRLRGMHLAIATFAVAEITTVLLAAFPIPGYNLGQLVPHPGFARTQAGFFVLSAVVAAVICVVISFVIRGRMGATWSMLREERASAGAGKNVLVGKLTVFCISAAIASAAGVLLITQNGSVDSSSFAPAASLLIVVLAMFLGGGTPEGAVMGGILSALTPWLFDELNVADDLPNLFFAYGAVDVLSKFPEGISQHAQQRRRVARAARQAVRAGDAVRVTSPLAESATEARKSAPRIGVIGSTIAERARTPDEVPALVIDALRVQYGAFVALDGVSLVVPARSVVGLIGPNGAGKTTLIDAASGFASYQGGTISVAGGKVDGMPPHRRVRAGLRRTFQQSRASGNLTARRYMKFVAGSAHTEENMNLALELLSVPWPDRFLGEMDVPTRRLVEVAAAIAAAPLVLLLDEPAAGLGERESKILSEQLAAVPNLFGTAVVLIEHDMDVVRSVCSEITVLDYGQVIAQGETDEMLRSTIVRRAYLGIGDEEEVAL